MNNRLTSIPFRGFDERGDVRVYYHGVLPHWRQANCTYFVTFRMADALPAAVIQELEYERDQWLQHRGIDVSSLKQAKLDWKSTIGKLSKADQRVYDRTMATKLNRYLDAGHGRCSLRRIDLRTIVADSLQFFHGDRVLTGDFVVMPNHVHVLMRPIGSSELEDVLQAIKSYTATKINRVLGEKGPFWMRESYDHIVRDGDQLEAFQNYIRANRKKAKLREDEFTYQSAKYCPDESIGGILPPPTSRGES
ncbi:MAG: transposase [Planctomycetota bacterium]